jgi:5'-nucleotidase
MEAASLGIPAMAVSLEAHSKYHLSYSNDVNFLVAADFTARIARMLLEKKFPADVRLLKVDVPSDATLETPWELTRVSMQRYYEPVSPIRKSWEEPGLMSYREAGNLENEPDGTDVYALRVKRVVSLTPLSLDMTSRVDFDELNKLMRIS